MFNGAWSPSGLTIQINVTTNWKVLDADSPSMDLFGLPPKRMALFDLRHLCSCTTILNVLGILIWMTEICCRPLQKSDSALLFPPVEYDETLKWEDLSKKMIRSMCSLRNGLSNKLGFGLLHVGSCWIWRNHWMCFVFWLWLNLQLQPFCLRCRLRLCHFLQFCHSLSLLRTCLQQIEVWKKPCVWRIRHCLFLHQHYFHVPQFRRHWSRWMKLLLLKLQELLPHENEPY